MKPLSERIKKRPIIGWLLFFVTMIIVFLLGLLASSIMERRAEAVFTYTPQVEYDDYEPRNEVWGENFPREYQSYYQTSDTSFKSMMCGNAMIDEIEEDPMLAVLWSGYAFSKDYKQGRGHFYAIEDIRNTLRTGAPMGDKVSPQPNTCWTCKSPDVPRLMKKMGIAEFYKGSWEQLGSEVVNPIGCADCHDAKTMNLKISRPALIEAYERNGKDITKASHQEMRSLVCAQCHVEYYFNKKKIEGVPYLTLPWDKGKSVEDIEKYYDEIEFSDWTHAISKTPMIKAQHPDFEVFMTGIHADRGVSCADCHMPYKSEGGQKFTDHHIQSPLNNIANSCQVCHREETESLIENVEERQEKNHESQMILEEILVKVHLEAGKAWELGATEEQMKSILQDIRHAQFRWDYAVAGHGSAFHSPIEVSRVFSTGINIAQNARIKLSRLLAALGFNEEMPFPDISTKDKSQKYIGLDMVTLNTEKSDFISKIIPDWIKKAKEREKSYSVVTK
jgi:nitrite reductase (cytochrome c-552)